MRKFRRLALFALLALSTFLIGVFVSRLRTTPDRKPSAWQVLLSFENQDLDGLAQPSKLVVQRAINQLAPRNGHRSNPTVRAEPLSHYRQCQR